MDERETLLFLHLLGAFLLVAGAGAQTALGLRAAASNSTRIVGAAAGAQTVVQYAAIVPGALIAIVFGTMLITRFDAYDFSDAWISASYLLWLGALGAATGYLGPQARKLRDHAHALLADGVEESEELRLHADARGPKAVGMALNVVIVVFLFLMVVKPG